VMPVISARFIWASIVGALIRSRQLAHHFRAARLYRSTPAGSITETPMHVDHAISDTNALHRVFRRRHHDSR
jgi:hypothetical protein